MRIFGQLRGGNDAHETEWCALGRNTSDRSSDGHLAHNVGLRRSLAARRQLMEFKTVDEDDGNDARRVPFRQSGFRGQRDAFGVWALVA